jgi:hypothetical protein
MLRAAAERVARFARAERSAATAAIVTSSCKKCKYLSATISSALAQNYPALSYHVWDAAWQDGRVELLESYGLT